MKCKKHLKVEAAAACVACGNFFCSDCLTVVKRKNYCPDCVRSMLEEEPQSQKQIVFSQQQSQQQSSSSDSIPSKPNDRGLIASWLVSGVLLLAALGSLASSVVTFFFYLLAGLLWLPPLTEWLKKEKNLGIPLWAKIALTLFFLAIASAAYKPPVTK